VRRSRSRGNARRLFAEPIGERRRKLEQVSGRIAERFGTKSLRRAALLEKE